MPEAAQQRPEQATAGKKGMRFGSFGRQTAIYTIGNLIYRGASFLLVPLYAHTLHPAEYGKLELITITVSIIQSVFGSGVAHSALRFYYEYDTPEERRSVISTAFLGSFLVSSLGGLGLAVLAAQVSRLVFGSPDYVLAFRLVAISMVLEISREISLAYIRANERSMWFMVVSLVQLCAQVSATVVTVVVLHMGLVGILLGNLIATTCIWGVLTTAVLRECGFHLDVRKLPALAAYGFPVMLSGLSGSVFQSLDRYALNAFASLQALGQYALSLRIANAIPVLLVTPFTNSYGPYRFSIMKEEGAGHIYARVLSYYTICSAFVVMGIASASREILMIFAGPEYWPAYHIVPVVLLPLGLYGVNYCLQTGIYILKKTKHFLYISIGLGATELALLYLLVPRLGILGAALASLGATAYGLTHTFIVSQRLYPVRYEYVRLAKILATAALLTLINLQIQLPNVWASLAVKTAVLLTYPALLVLLRCFAEDEKQMLRTQWNRLRSRVQASAPAC